MLAIQSKEAEEGDWLYMLKLMLFSVFTRFSEKSFAMTAMATRDIEAGEELSISCKLAQAPSFTSPYHDC